MLQSPAQLAPDDRPAKGRPCALSVAEVVEETHDAKSFVFAVPDALQELFCYRAGQFLTVEVPWQDRMLRRCYSLASSPECDAAPKVTVKRVPGGRVSNWLNDNVRPGDTLSVFPPEGRFILTDTDAPLVLFAGGSGVTPVISLVKTALLTSSRPIDLLYANRNERSIIFHGELAALARKHPNRLRIRYHFDDARGFATPDDVCAFASQTGTHGIFYLCGPGPFMETVEAGLARAGVDPARIRIERFVSPSDNPEAFETAPIAGEAHELPDHIEIVLRGEAHTVKYEEGSSILRAVRDAGLDPPYSCEDGFCGCCAAHLLEGRVFMAATDALSEEEKRRGLILTCQAKPLTRRCRIRYDE